MAFLQNLVDGDQSFECLDLIGKNGLAAISWIRSHQQLNLEKYRRWHVNLHLHARPEGL